MSDKRVLVFGAGGFIGRRVVECLAERGIKVRAVDLAFQDAQEPANHVLVERVVGNITDEPFVASVSQLCDTVVYLASNSLPASANFDLAGEVQAHVRAVVKVAEICDAQGVERFVFASSGGTVYGTDSNRPLRETDGTFPRNAYGASKLAIEHFLRILGALRRMKTVSLRISNPFGEGQVANRGQGFIAAAMQHAAAGETLTLWGDGSAVRDFIYVGDVAEAILAACFYNGEQPVINVGAGQGHSLNEIVRQIETVSSVSLALSYQMSRSFDVSKNVLDINLAMSELNWRPSLTLTEGLDLTWGWWLKKSE